MPIAAPPTGEVKTDDTIPAATPTAALAAFPAAAFAAAFAAALKPVFAATLLAIVPTIAPAANPPPVDAITRFFKSSSGSISAKLYIFSTLISVVTE